MSRRIKPHKVPGRELEEVRQNDPDGRIVYHHRTMDTLGKMPRTSRRLSSSLTSIPLRAIPILRVPGTGREPEPNERQVDARQRVHLALEALGGLSSPAGSCVWHVVGLQRSVREWAIRQGWCGRLAEQKQATGILVAALGVLAAHLGYAGVKRAS